MVQAGHDDLISRRKLAGQAARYVQGQGRHVLSKGDLLRPRGAKEISKRAPRIGHHFIRLPARAEGPAVICVPVNQVIIHTVNRLFADLRAGGLSK